MAGLIGRYLAARTAAEARGDGALVRELTFQLERLGWQPDTDSALGPAAAAAEARAEQGVRPKGRPTTRR